MERLLRTVDDPTYGAVKGEEGPEWAPKARRAECVYFLHAPDIRRVKVGFSRNPKQRAVAIRSYERLPHEIRLELLGRIDGGRATERVIHERFAEHHVSGEWFSDEILPDVGQLIADDRDWFGD